MEPKRMFRRTKKQVTASNRAFAIMQVAGMKSSLIAMRDKRINPENVNLRESINTSLRVIENLRKTIANSKIDDWR